MSLTQYRKKRDFKKTPEPKPKAGRKKRSDLKFVIQKHAASRLHYDFRLEWEGTLKSWAVPKGPSLDPSEKQLAVQVEDHPLDYAGFEGVIPEGQYGGGTVMVWDQGTWKPNGDAAKGFQSGKISFELQGEKLHGNWALVQMHGDAGDGGKNWLLIKEKDDVAQTGKKADIVQREPLSVVSGRDLDQIAEDSDQVWTSGVARKSSTSKKHSSKSDGKSKAKKTSKAKSRTKAKAAFSLNDALDALEEAKSGTAAKDFRPQLATLVATAPQGEQWLHEMKFDGYRLLAHFKDSGVRLITRNGKDWTSKFPGVAEELESLGLESGVVDGEVVILKSDGTPDFQKLQNSIKAGRDADFVYYAFDLPYCNGRDLRKVPLIDRKRVLEQLCEVAFDDNVGTIRFSEHIDGHGGQVFEQSCQGGMEGIISKRADSSYVSRRSPDWRKTKCLHRQEFVIAGVTKPGGARKGFGSLLLGYYESDDLIYCGRVGTGFTAATLKQLSDRLKSLERKTSPFKKPPKEARRDLQFWVTPELVVEVEFTEWTGDGALRHPSFKGLREDKSPRAIHRETPVNNNGKSSNAKTRTKTNKTRGNSSDSAGCVIAGVTISHPDRVLYPELGLTKCELARFYECIADWVLPSIVDRPLTMVRCPQGSGKQCFYQKHFSDHLPKGLTTIPIKEKSKTDDYVLVHDLQGLVALVQHGVLEFHPWGAKADDIERPDQIIFDLDPGEGADWGQVVQGARDVKSLLDDVGLQSFLRTSGGKGLHVLLPLTRRREWDDVKAFSRAVATRLSSEFPDRYVDTLSKAKRKGKVFVDYLRNGRGATAVASYSTRARSGAPVATPLRWDELSTSLKPDQYTVHNLQSRLSGLSSDPWAEFFTVRQSLTNKVMKTLSVALAGE